MSFHHFLSVCEAVKRCFVYYANRVFVHIVSYLHFRVFTIQAFRTCVDINIVTRIVVADNVTLNVSRDRRSHLFDYVS